MRMTVDDFCSILSRDERWQAFLVNFGQCWESGLFADPHALGRLLRDWMDDCLRVYPNPEDFNSSAVRSMLIDRLNSGFRLWGRPIAGVEVRGLSRVMAVGDALWSTHRLFDLEALADAGLTEDDEFHEDFFDWLSDLRGRRSEALDIGASMRGQLRLFWATRADAIESMRAGLSLDRPSDSLAIAVVDGLGLEQEPLSGLDEGRQ